MLVRDTQQREFVYYGSLTMSPQIMEAMVFYDNSVIAVDVETVSLTDRRVLGIGIAISPQHSFWFPVWPARSSYIDRVVQLLRNPGILKLYHNILFDADCLEQFGIDLTAVCDTMLLAHSLGLPLKLSVLDSNAGVFDKDAFKKGKTCLDLDEAVLAKKNCMDTAATYNVYREYESQVDWPLLLQDMKLIPVLLAMHRKGMRVDQEQVKSLEIELGIQVESSRILCSQMLGGFNPASSKQVANILLRAGVVLPRKRSKTTRQYYTPADAEALEHINHPIATLTLEYRKHAKLLSTYVRPLLGVLRVHTHYGMTTATWRLSSSEPNLQNIPRAKEYRAIFVPDRDKLTKLDNDQQELRVFAHLSQDKAMMEIYNRGGDLHAETSIACNVDRPTAKISNFALIFGAEPETLAKITGQSVRTMKDFMKRWAKKFPQAWAWREDVMDYGEKHREVRTLGGRRLFLKAPTVHGIRKQACNYPVQGTGAEITQAQMLKVYNAGLDLRMQVHDELVCDGDVSAELNTLDLANVSTVYTPVKITVGERWE